MRQASRLIGAASRREASRAALLVGTLALGSCSDADSIGTASEAGAMGAGDAGLAPDAGGAHCRNYTPERQPFFGDLHVHTALSLDANLQGTRLRPADAYLFARGEPVGVPPYDARGNPARRIALERPLDFVAVSDHAEFLGLVTTCLSPELPGYDSASCATYRSAPSSAFYQFNGALGTPQGGAGYVAPCGPDNAYCGSAAMSAWTEIQSAAAAAQDATPDCRFTTFVAYEWSASPGVKNLHRNVIFASEAVPKLPFSYFDGNQEEELWSALESGCRREDGCEALTIPHNSNLSAGLMFETVDRAGQPFDRRYAERRARYEPLVEVFQNKGSSECLPSMGPDELCDYEISPYTSLGTTFLGGTPEPPIASDYMRDALGRGLSLQRQLGVNPFAYGLVASTDTHFGLAGGVEERTYLGHGGASPSALAATGAGITDSPWFNPGGLAVLWAEENTRRALFDAMKRREAYGTSGPRIVLRLFGGFGLPTSMCSDGDFVRTGYASGVPMGGELRARGATEKPRFAVWAEREADTASRPGGLLERIQLIKGALVDGQVRYAILEQTSGLQGGVDAKTCQPTGRGADSLCHVWEDATFDPQVPAFYYARVLENPSCRWLTHACLAAKVDCATPATVTKGYEPCCAGYPATQQERAWSSPIFYYPP